VPIYRCPKCGRTVEMPEGRYYCKVCGSSAIMVKLTQDNLFKETTDIPFYDSMLRNPDYFRRAKGLTFHIERLSPDEYMEKIAEMQRVSVSHEWELIDKGSVEHLLNLIKEGEKLAMPVIDYAHKLQEGRNRMAVAKKLGVKKVPVMIVEAC